MMCQRIGRSPISTIGFGRVSVSSASRVPRPPARITTFISAPHPRPAGNDSSDGQRDPLRPRRGLPFHDLDDERGRLRRLVVDGPDPQTASVLERDHEDALLAADAVEAARGPDDPAADDLARVLAETETRRGDLGRVGEQRLVVERRARPPPEATERRMPPPTFGDEPPPARR